MSRGDLSGTWALHYDKLHQKFNPISVGYVQKTTQKQPKILLFAGMKTFRISKLENFKSEINETWSRLVPPKRH